MFVKRPRIFVVGILVLTLVISSLTIGCTSATTSKLRVVTTTSLLQQIVERVSGDLVDLVNIIPPAQCPGHFDVKPSDIQKLADADLFLVHGWQGEMFTQELIDSAENTDLTTERINIQGNWMTPSVQTQAIDTITAILSQMDEENADAYQQSATELKSIIESKGTEITAQLADKNLASVNVMCNEQQAGFVQWAGLNIVTTYGRPDSLTPQVVQDLVDQGREGDVTLIIDNLQSGQDAGAGIAEELDCDRIILSNFPGGFDNTETWEKAIDENIRLILEATAQ